MYFIHWSRYVFWATGILETTIGNNDVGGIRVKVLRESILGRRRLRLEFLELAFGKWSVDADVEERGRKNLTH